MKCLIFITLIFINGVAIAQKSCRKYISSAADRIENKIIDWRSNIHKNPELGNREVRTAALVAKHLQSLGIEVKTNVAVTGVVGILRGDQAGPVIGLRADMCQAFISTLADCQRDTTVNYQRRITRMNFFLMKVGLKPV